jgi:hypothetical protein
MTAVQIRGGGGMTATTRMCSECARDFEWTPGLGRPPMRCPRCRRENPSTPAKRAKVAAVAAVTPARGNGAHPVALVEEVESVEPVSGGPLDIPAIQAAVAGEIEQLEEALAVRLRLQLALDGLAAHRAKCAGTS